MTIGPWDETTGIGPSEYGGDDGLVQPLEKGHVLTPSETAGMVHRTDPMDESAVDPVTGYAVPAIPSGE
jgi:hypothetical protein